MYPFSLTIFYPSLDEKDAFGRIPIYAKIIPRGDVSSLRSDISTLELMTVFYMSLFIFSIFCL